MDQVNPWMRKVTPPASKGYAVYSCVRETANSTPSALAFVDPPEQSGGFPIALPSTWVRCRNYSAWLAAMGFVSAARRLRADSESKPESVELMTARIEGRVFGLVDIGWDSKIGVVGIGMEVNALNAISAAITGSDKELMAYRAETVVWVGEGGERSNSIFPDGTFLGVVDGEALEGVRTFIIYARRGRSARGVQSKCRGLQ